MALFQEAIIKKHLNLIDDNIIEQAFSEYKRVYSPDKIKNIRVAKEEQYQEGFIKEIFGSVLGYSVYPESPYNIETEKKNETNSKKADGAILKDEKVVGVIELKDNKTKNLDAVKDQAFGYKNNHKDCSYVISSNFHKLRFYIDDATDYEEFDLYNLDKETFKRFYLYLRKEGLLDKNLPKLLRQETKFHEEEISKKLYKDYSNFKRSFFENAVLNNPQYDKLELFKKSQKFLDRILFLLFAEDKGLVGTNSIVNIVEKWSNADDDYYIPLYEMVNKYFGHLYRGYTYQKTGEVIPQFGGELFAPDEMLESLKIDDAILKNDLLVLSKYDFNTDVDVNILGHIFEHSLNEVDDVEAELRGETLDKTKSKRKKDGVFYTPKYITKYIVDNTLGKLCTEKKIELKLDEDIAIFEYQKADGKLNEKGKELYERLNTYKSWLLTVKVCDPACGSGAFLNQALSYFIEEHKFVDDIIAELTNTPLRLFDTDLQILENNIFGVDINDESVEIAKLSMWLRTAQPGRKLSDLSNNIKCGNSLIDDPAIAGDKAFNWEKEFPTVFEKGGFDVVIGNPPYGADLSKADKEYLKIKFPKIDSSTPNSYAYFMGLAYNLSNVIGYIIPDSFLVKDFEKTRKLFKRGISNLVWYQNTGMPDEIKPFAEVEHDVVTFIFNKYYLENNISCKLYQYSNNTISEKVFEKEINEICDDRYFNFYNLLIDDVCIRIKCRVKDHLELNQICQIHEGIHSGNIRDKLFTKNSENNKPLFLGGKNGDVIDNYISIRSGWYVNYRKDIIDQEKNEYASLREESIFNLPKVYITRTGNPFKCFIDEGNYASNNFFSLQTKDIEKNHLEDLSFFVSLLNSKFSQFYIRKIIAPRIGDSFIETKIIHLLKLPVPANYENSKRGFKSLVEKMVLHKTELLNFLDKFSKFFSNKLKSEKLPGKLDRWHELEFVDFIKELNKSIKLTKGSPLTKKDEFEWMELFEENKKKALDLKTQIDQTEKEIDRMVYELYGLTEEEIQIVENS